MPQGWRTHRDTGNGGIPGEDSAALRPLPYTSLPSGCSLVVSFIRTGNSKQRAFLSSLSQPSKLSSLSEEGQREPSVQIQLDRSMGSSWEREWCLKWKHLTGLSRSPAGCALVLGSQCQN